MSDTTIDDILNEVHDDYTSNMIGIKSGEYASVLKAKSALYDLILKEVIGEDIIWEWKPYNELHDLEGLDPKEFNFKVCTVCDEDEYHPDSIHLCEYDNERRASQRNKLKGLFK